MESVSIRLSGDLVKKATLSSKIEHRSIAKQIEHWAKIGELVEENSDLSYSFIKQALQSQVQPEQGQLEEYSFG